MIRLSEYNEKVMGNSMKSLIKEGLKCRILAQKSDTDMIWSVEKNGFKKIVWIHEGVAVAGIDE